MRFNFKVSRSVKTISFIFEYCRVKNHAASMHFTKNINLGHETFFFIFSLWNWGGKCLTYRGCVMNHQKSFYFFLNIQTYARIFHVYELHDIYRFTHKKVSPLLYAKDYWIIEKLKIIFFIIRIFTKKNYNHIVTAFR